MIEQQTPTAPLAWLLMRPPIRDASLPSRVHRAHDDDAEIAPHIAEHPGISAQEIADDLGLPIDQVRGHIRLLLQGGKVRGVKGREVMHYYSEADRG